MNPLRTAPPVVVRGANALLMQIPVDGRNVPMKQSPEQGLVQIQIPELLPV